AWNLFTEGADPTPLTNIALPHLDVEQGLDLHVAGTVDVSLTGVFTATGSGSLDVGEVSDTAAGQGNVVGDHARAVALSLDTSVAAGGVGSLGASLKLVSVSQGTASWLGVDASGINVSMAVDPLTVAVTDGELKLNRFGGTASGKVDWSTFTTAAGHGGGMHL